MKKSLPWKAAAQVATQDTAQSYYQLRLIEGWRLSFCKVPPIVGRVAPRLLDDLIDRPGEQVRMSAKQITERVLAATHIACDALQRGHGMLNCTAGLGVRPPG